MHAIMQFEYHLSLVLAHSALLYTKGEEPLGTAWCLNGGDPPAPPVTESTADMMRAMQENLPGYMSTLRKEIIPTEQAQLEASQQVSPGYANLAADIYDTTGRRLNTIGEEIAASNQMAKARSDASVLQGPGMDIVKAADAAQRVVDPEFYKMREATGRLGTNIINSFGEDPAQLSGSERAEIERGLAQENSSRGMFAAPSQVDAVGNAMAFGNAANARRAGAANVLGALSQPMVATRSGVDVLQQATGRPGQVNSGAPLVTGAREAGSNAFAQGSNLLAQTGENQRTAMGINANRRDSLDRFNDTFSSVSSGIGSICCFIFMEAYNGKLPWYVRAARDLHYEKEPGLAIGYRKMATWLVPLMQKSKVTRWLVNVLMIKPLTAHGAWLFNLNRYGFLATPIKSFWFAVWRHS